MAAWIYRPLASNIIIPFCINSVGGQGWVVSQINLAGTYYIFTDGINPGNNKSVAVSDFPAANIWSFVLLQTTTSSIEYYLNGTIRHSSAFAIALDTSPLSPGIQIGSFSFVGWYSTGYIGRASLYSNIPLFTAAKINSMYQQERHIYGV